MIKQLSRLTTLAEDLKDLGIVSKDIGFGYTVDENGEVINLTRQNQIAVETLAEQNRQDSIKAIFEAVPAHFRVAKKDGTHQVVTENEDGDIEVVILEQANAEVLAKLSEKVLTEAKTEGAKTLTEADETGKDVKKNDKKSDFDADTGVDIEEGIGRVRLKRMSSGARAKARRSYRANKSTIKRSRKKLRRTSKFKRRSKLLKRLKHGKSAGPHRRFVLKMGMEQTSNLLEQTQKFGFLTEAQNAQFPSLLEGIKEAALALSEAIDEADAYIMTVDDLSTDQGEEGYDWVDVDQDGEYEDEEQDDDAQCGDVDNEDAWMDVCESNGLRKLAEDTEAAMTDFSKGVTTPEEMKKIITTMVQYLGGALQTYTALAQQIKDYVGLIDTPSVAEGEVKSPVVEAEQVGEGAPKEVEHSVKTEKVNEPVVGEDSKLDGVGQKVVPAAAHGDEVGKTDEPKTDPEFKVAAPAVADAERVGIKEGKEIDEEDVKKKLVDLYMQYSKALRTKDDKEIAAVAKQYNDALKAAGGPAKNPGESYLSFGKKGAVKEEKQSKLASRIKLHESVSSKVLDSYLATALWSSVDDGGESMDKYSIGQIDQKSKAEAQKELEDFFTQAEAMFGDEWAEIDDKKVAHDFWLTRNGHGAGFWDGDYEKEMGKKLTELSKKFGEKNVWASTEDKEDDSEVNVYIEEYLGKGKPKPEGEAPDVEGVSDSERVGKGEPSDDVDSPKTVGISDKDRAGKKTEPHETQKILESSAQVTGSIKWNRPSGDGYILPDQGGESIYFGKESVLSKKELKRGEKVSFELKNVAGGKVAVNVKPQQMEGCSEVDEAASKEDVLAQLKKIVETGSMGKVNGHHVDMQTANAILTVHDAVSDANKEKLLAMPVSKMASTAWKLLGKKG